MMNDDEGARDWEMKDEEPPERLQKKWEREEASDPGTVICPACRKEAPKGNWACIFCGHRLPQECCPLTCLLTWVKRLFKKG